METKKIAEKKNTKDIQKEADKDKELINGIFKNYEHPGGTLCFMAKIHHDDEFKPWEFKDGERYKIPRGIAKHLTNNCFFYEYKHEPGHFGQEGMRTAFNDGRLRANKMQMARKVYRFGWQSLEFMDDDPSLNQSNLIEVRY